MHLESRRDATDLEVKKLSEDAVGNVLHRYILEVTVQALIQAEWDRFQATIDRSEHPGLAPAVITRKVGTRLGRIRVAIPAEPEINFQSCILNCPQRELSVPIERLLELPFVDNEEELGAVLSGIFGDRMPYDLIKIFVERLSDLLLSQQATKLNAVYPHSYFGTIQILSCRTEGSGLRNLLHYCVLCDSEGHLRVAGVWDISENGDEKTRWMEIVAELKKRGLSAPGEIIADSAQDGATLQYAFDGDASDSAHLCNDDSSLEGGGEWSGRQADALFDPPTLEELTPEIQQVVAALTPEPHVDGGGESEIVHSMLMRDIAIAFFGAFVLTALVMMSYHYLIQHRSTQSPAHLAEYPIQTETKNLNLISALEQIKEPKDPAIQAALLNLSGHRDYQVRIAVIRAVALNEHLVTDERTTFLKRMLRDRDYLVRGYAVKTLGQLGTPEAMSILQSRLALEKDGIVLALIQKILGSRL